MGLLGRTTQMDYGGYGLGTPRLPYHSKMVGCQNHQEPGNFQKTKIIVAV